MKPQIEHNPDIADEINRYRGCFVGLAVGDALGVPYEFSFPQDVKYTGKMEAGGVFNLPVGHYTDDASMNLCLALSLLEEGFDMYSQAGMYVNWYQRGTLSSTGECFDIGNQTQFALDQYIAKYEFPEDSTMAGNGSLMRIAPIPMLYSGEELEKYAKLSSQVTHNNSDCIFCCVTYSKMIRTALEGGSKDDIFKHDVRHKDFKDIKNTGYVYDSYFAACAAFLRTDSFEECMKFIIELGGDTDTNACIAGMLAGAYYGFSGIPTEWFDMLKDNEMFKRIADRLWIKRNRPELCDANTVIIG